MDAITIKIRQKDYSIKQSFRSYLLFEEMTNKQISEIETLKDILTLLYCTLKGCNKDFNFSFDEYIDLIDEDSTILAKFNDYNSVLSNPTPEKKTKKV